MFVKHFHKFFLFIAAAIISIYSIKNGFGMMSAVYFFILLGIYISIAYGIITGILLLFRRHTTGIKGYFLGVGKIYKNLLYFFAIIFVLLEVFLVWNNTLFPAKVPKVILQNGEQKLILYGMSHIGTDVYYKNIIQDMNQEAKSSSGGILLLEGVGSGTELEKKEFNSYLGLELNQETYKNLAQLFGMTSQSEYKFSLPNFSEKNSDLTLSEILILMRKRIVQKNLSGEALPKPVKIDENLSILLGDLQNKNSSYDAEIFRALINSLSRSHGFEEVFLQPGIQKEFFEVILHERNSYIVGDILDRKEKNIVVMYGALHINGIIEELQKRDSNWKILSIDFFTPYSFESRSSSGSVLPQK